ncbi:MAG: glutathione S-transferase [Betaproteobacteria bacterium]|nr:glutathione S-transferase [Betaproteobacteria bacterium]
MRLWYNPASPFARKVRIVARETGLAEGIDEVNTVVSPVKPNAELARENPLIKIPTLAVPGEGTLYDSAVICEYLDSLHPGAPLFPGAGAERWRALRLQALGDGILDAAVLMRYEGVVRPEALRWGDWISGQLEKIRGGLSALDRECAGWGDRFAIGQITAACVLGYLDFRFAEQDWRAPHPALAQWYAGVAQRPSMKATLPQ